MPPLSPPTAAVVQYVANSLECRALEILDSGWEPCCLGCGPARQRASASCRAVAGFFRMKAVALRESLCALEEGRQKRPIPLPLFKLDLPGLLHLPQTTDRCSGCNALLEWVRGAEGTFAEQGGLVCLLCRYTCWSTHPHSLPALVVWPVQAHGNELVALDGDAQFRQQACRPQDTHGYAAPAAASLMGCP